MGRPADAQGGQMRPLGSKRLRIWANGGHGGGTDLGSWILSAGWPSPGRVEALAHFLSQT